MSAEIVKFPLKPSMIVHPYLNGFGRGEWLTELQRISRRLNNTIAALKRRQQAVRRAARIEISRQLREKRIERPPRRRRKTKP